MPEILNTVQANRLLIRLSRSASVPITFAYTRKSGGVTVPAPMFDNCMLSVYDNKDNVVYSFSKIAGADKAYYAVDTENATITVFFSSALMQTWDDNAYELRVVRKDANNEPFNSAKAELRLED